MLLADQDVFELFDLCKLFLLAPQLANAIVFDENVRTVLNRLQIVILFLQFKIRINC